jgi:hypothetical protein
MCVIVILKALERNYKFYNMNTYIKMGLYPPLMPAHATVAFYSMFHMVPNYGPYIVAWTADLELRSQKSFIAPHTEEMCALFVTPHAHWRQAQYSQSQSEFGVPQLREGHTTDRSHTSCSSTLFFSSYILVLSAIPSPPYPV